MGGVHPLGGEVCAALLTSKLDVEAGLRVFTSGGSSAEHFSTATSAGEWKKCRVAGKLETEEKIFSESSRTEDTFPGGCRAVATGSRASSCVLTYFWN